MFQDMMFLRVALLMTALVQGLLIPGSKGEGVGYNNNYTDPQFLYVIGKVGENCDEDRQMPIMYRQECEKAASAIQDSSYLNLTYEGKVEYNNVQFGCIVDEEAKLVWYNEVGVGGETGSQYKGESKFSPICEKEICRTKINGKNVPMRMPCIFPFTYENVTYHKCVGNFLFPRLDGEQGICPVFGDPDGSWYENKEQWGFCELKPRGMCEKTEDIKPTTTPAPECDAPEYERLEKILEDKEKGKLLATPEIVKSYTECESLCNKNQDCMNFEHCPSQKTCRIFDKKIRGVEYLKQKQWYDCYGNYATCKPVQG